MRMRGVNRSFIIAVSFMLSLFKAHADPLCHVLLSSPHEINSREDLDETGQFVAYLKELFDRRTISRDQLSRFVLGLKRGEVLNPLQNEDDSASEIQRDGIQVYLDHPALDKDRLLGWAEQELAIRKQAQASRAETHEGTEKPYRKIEFHPVRGGRFKMGQERLEVHLTYAIEVMSTPVTQAQWVEIMGENPSGYSDGEHSMVIRRNGKTIQMQPDHPVENITWWSALFFANKLSEKHGLTPVYDLSEVDWKPGTRAENGDLEAEKGRVKINARGRIYDPPKGSVYYQSQGYRLPTEAEQEYLLTGGGVANELYSFGGDETKIKEYAWYRDNSGGKTHPVAELMPVVIDGNNFYDLYGNVWEWGWDQYDNVLKGGRDPVRSGSGSRSVQRGGCLGTLAESLFPHIRAQRGRNHHFDNGGVRLVRTISRP